MRRRFSNHGFDELMQIHIYKNGLQQKPKFLLDVNDGYSLMSKSVGDSPMSKSVEDATAVIERITLTDHQAQNNRNLTPRKIV